MKKIVFYLLLFLPLLGIGVKGLQAQQTIPASGGNATGSGGSVSYTVGQIVYTTYTGTNGSMAQGVQQPYEISIVNGIAEAQSITLLCTVYPNPVTDRLTLKVDASTIFSKQLMYYQLFDLNGKILVNKQIVANETNIVMSNLVAAIYFLKVIQDNKVIKTFKIIKN